MQDSTLIFIPKFFSDVTRVAAVVPSSRAVALENCRYVDSTRPQTILELGAGTGAITTVALEKMHPSSTLLVVEIDPDFIPILEKRCAGAQIIHSDQVIGSVPTDPDEPGSMLFLPLIVSN